MLFLLLLRMCKTAIIHNRRFLRGGVQGSFLLLFIVYCRRCARLGGHVPCAQCMKASSNKERRLVRVVRMVEQGEEKFANEVILELEM